MGQLLDFAALSLSIVLDFFIKTTGTGTQTQTTRHEEGRRTWEVDVRDFAGRHHHVPPTEDTHGDRPAERDGVWCVVQRPAVNRATDCL